MARRSGVQDFLTNFNMAFGLTDKVGQAFEIADIAKAKPEEAQGFTTEQGAELEAAAKSGQYDIGTKTKDDGTFEAYTVTPKADPTQTGMVAQQGVTDFMGTRTAGSMSPDQVNTARERAMAGVIMKRDPVQGMRMMRDITQAGRDDERYGWEKNRNERESRLATEQDADKLAMKSLDTEVGDWFKTRLAGPDGQPRAATVDDHLAASQFRAGKLAQSGKMDEAGKIMKDYNAQALVKIQLEGAQRNEELGKAAAALAAGDLGPVKDFYNRFTPDGAQVTNITRGKSGEVVIERAADDGRPLPPTIMKDQGQILAALNTFKDPMALYNWSQNEFKNNLAIKADKRADNADGRAGAQFSQGQSDRAEAKNEKTAKADAAVALFRDRNPAASTAEIEAVRRGILEAAPTADKNAPAEVKLAQAYRRAGLAKDDAEALRMATQSRSDSPEKVRADIYGKALTANMGNAKAAQEATAEAMKYLYPEAPAAAPGRSSSGKITAEIPPADKRVVGERYDTPKGPMVWRGNGWEPAK